MHAAPSVNVGDQPKVTQTGAGAAKHFQGGSAAPGWGLPALGDSQVDLKDSPAHPEPSSTLPGPLHPCAAGAREGGARVPAGARTRVGAPPRSPSGSR